MKKGLIITASVIGGAALIYIEASFLMIDRFPFRTSINGSDVSLKKYTAANEQEKTRADGYTLQILKRDNTSAEIEGSSIGLSTSYNEEEFQEATGRSFLTWPASLIFPENYTVSSCVNFSEDELSSAVDSLSLSTSDPSDLENMLDEDLTKEVIKQAVSELQPTVSLEDSGCYLSLDDAKVRQKQMEFDLILSSYDDYTISVPIGSDGITIDTDTIKSWIHKPDDSFEDTAESQTEGQETVEDSATDTESSNIEIEGGDGAYIAVDSITQYVEDLAAKYNTYGVPHTFTTHNGDTVKLTLGDYGWWLNQGETRDAIVNALINRETSVEPVFYQKAIQWPSEENNNDDVGNTYAEVDLDSQHVWMWKDGEVVWDSDCVSGNASVGHGTPDGIYSIKLKQLNAILRGDGYASHVNYWMPFNLGIGFHDASWRSSFGGDIYTYSGSHGCINLPSSKVGEFYEKISTGDPVIVYGGMSQEEAKNLTTHTGGTSTESGSYTPPAAITQAPAQDAVIPDAVTPESGAIDPVTGAVIPSITGDPTAQAAAIAAAQAAAAQAAGQTGTASGQQAADSPEAVQAQVQSEAQKVAADMYNQQIAAGASNEDAMAAAQKTAESYVSQAAQQ